MTELECVVVEAAADAQPCGVVVWLHGLGASGHDFPPVVPHLGLPGVRFVFPHAPQRPVTINGGLVMPAWYDIKVLGPGGTNEQHVEKTTSQVEALLAIEERRFGSERVVLAGFSQGGAIALHAGLRHAHKLAGILVLSAYEMFPERRAHEAAAANAQTPILFCHGTGDPMVPSSRGRAAYEAVNAAGWPTQWLDYPMGHEVCMPEIQDIGHWLKQRLEESS